MLDGLMAKFQQKYIKYFEQKTGNRGGNDNTFIGGAGGGHKDSIVGA